MADILRFTGPSTVPVPPETVLEQAKGWELGRVVIIGLTEDGEFKYGGSHCDIPMIVMLLGIAHKRMLEQADP